MATKIAHPSNFAAVESVENNAHEIRLEIDGLIADSDGTFVLRGVKPIELDYKAFDQLLEILQADGVPRRLARRLTEEAYDTVMTGLLADALAQRTKRVG
jgi:hypothetical protein